MRELNLFYSNNIDSTVSEWIKDTLYPLNDTITIINDSITKSNDSIKEKNQNTIKNSLWDLKKEISCIRRNLLKFNNYDSLMSWATMNRPKISNTGNLVLDSLTVKAIREHNCCREIHPSKNKIFPTLLIFHTLIVLVLAFVTQLLISDKSVTEPL